MEPERRDEELLESFLGGDRAAFGILMERHQQKIFAMALRMTGDRNDALDATQDAFLAAFRRASTFRGDAAFATWLYQIAINSCRDLLRKRKPTTPLDAVAEPGHGEHHDHAALRADVARGLAALPDEYRQAVALHDLLDVPYEEIASITGVALGTVKSRISRGRRRLAELLEPGGGARPSKGQSASTTDPGAIST